MFSNYWPKYMFLDTAVAEIKEQKYEKACFEIIAFEVENVLYFKSATK